MRKLESAEKDMLQTITTVTVNWGEFERFVFPSYLSIIAFNHVQPGLNVDLDTLRTHNVQIEYDGCRVCEDMKEKGSVRTRPACTNSPQVTVLKDPNLNN